MNGAVLVVLLAILVSGALAAPSVTISPAIVTPGQPITVTFQNLLDGSSLQTTIGSNVRTGSGVPFQFADNGLFIPFDLTDAEIYTQLFPLVADQPCQVSVEKGDVIVTRSGIPTSGSWSTTVSGGTLSPGNYNIVYTGTPASDHMVVIIRISGTKDSGPADSQMEFTPEGINWAATRVSVYVNGTLIRTQFVYILP